MCNRFSVGRLSTGSQSYCNRTATGLVQFGTRQTQQMIDVGKNAAKQPNYRTCQYGMKWGMWNLQGGGRWFEPSIAHLEKSCKKQYFADKERGRGYASWPSYCNPNGDWLTTWFSTPLPSSRQLTASCARSASVVRDLVLATSAAAVRSARSRRRRVAQGNEAGGLRPQGSSAAVGPPGGALDISV
jgi:hypothetical protein